MRNHGVLRSTTHGLTPWRRGAFYPNGMLGAQDDDVLITGKLNEVLPEELFTAGLRALAKGVGRGMGSTSPENDPALWKAFALAAAPEPEPLVIAKPLTPALRFPEKSYTTIRSKFGKDPAKFQSTLGRQLQRLWCNGRRSAGRPLIEIAAQCLGSTEELSAFAATPLGQTHVIRLSRMFQDLAESQPNHVACVVLHACMLYSPTAVEDLICEAYEAGTRLSTLQLHQLLEHAKEHPEVDAAPFEFRLLMAFE